jgi:hypothetical protein
VRRLTRDDFSWAEAIPTLLHGHRRPAPDLEVPELERLAERPPTQSA